MVYDLSRQISKRSRREQTPTHLDAFQLLSRVYRMEEHPIALEQVRLRHGMRDAVLRRHGRRVRAMQALDALRRALVDALAPEVVARRRARRREAPLDRRPRAREYERRRLARAQSRG